jgi:hypothetical protein
LGWKLDRDSAERGHSAEKIAESISLRENDAKNFIEPQRALADWVIEFLPSKPVDQAEVFSGVRPPLIVRHTIPNEPAVDRVLSCLEEFSSKSSSFKVEPEPNDGEIDRICVRFSGEISHEEVSVIASGAFPDPRRITRGRKPPVFSAGFDGLNQLIAMALLENLAISENG